MKDIAILLAGANGYIGSHLYYQLERHSTVTAIDYGNYQTEKDFINLNLTDIDKVIDFADNCDHFDVLIFLVGLAHAKGKGKDLPEFKKLNYQTLVNLLSALEKNNKTPDKIIFASTISVYGEKYHQSIYTEESEKKPFSPYAVTKLEAEQYLKKNYSNRSWVLRFAPVYSQGFQLNISRRTKAINWFYKIGDGAKKLSLCNLENIGSAMQGIIEDKVPAGAYNISDESEYTYNDLLNHMNAKWVMPIPSIMMKGLYYIGKLINNIFLKENTIKLISDNIFPSDKIRKYISLTASLNE